MGRIHPVPLIAGVLVFVLTLQLGHWQTRRAAEKQTLQTAIEEGLRATPVNADQLVDIDEWRSVELEGEWVAERTVLLDNRVHDGRAGYHVLTPLRLRDGSGWVLVKRGWVAANADRSRLPDAGVPTGTVRVTGVTRAVEQGGFTLASEAGQGMVVQYLDLEAYRTRSGLPIRNWILEQHGESGDGLVRDWPRPDAGIDRHRGYALQWYSLAGLALVLTGIYVFRSVFRHET